MAEGLWALGAVPSVRTETPAGSGALLRASQVGGRFSAQRAPCKVQKEFLEEVTFECRVSCMSSEDRMST